MLIGTIVHAVAYSWLGYVTDWDAEADKAAIRAEVKLELSQVGELASDVHGVHRDDSDADETSALLSQNGHAESDTREHHPVAQDGTDYLDPSPNLILHLPEASASMHKQADLRLHMNDTAQLRPNA